MISLKLKLLIPILLGMSAVWAQENLPVVDSMSESSLTRDTLGNLTHSVLLPPVDGKRVGADTRLEPQQFNTGNCYDPLALIQGKVPGLMITRPGSNPNESYGIRLRGPVSLFDDTKPLWVIDGVVDLNPALLDPFDIASIEVHRDAATSAYYGSRASAGVINVKTKRSSQRGIGLQYNGYVAVEQLDDHLEVLDAQSYRGAIAGGLGGTDLGHSTDWLGEVSRTGVSQAHQLAISGGVGHTFYRLSMNYRRVEGVIRETGFRQFNGRLRLDQRMLHERVQLSLIVAVNNRNADIGLQEVYKYSKLMNPTAPIHDPTQMQYGGYFQENRFDYYNPVSLQQQNIHEGKYQLWVGQLHAEIELLKGLKAMATYSQQQDGSLEGYYFPIAAYGPGYSNHGLAIRRKDKDQQSLFNAFLAFDNNFGKLSVKAMAGYEYQQNELTFEERKAGNFITDGSYDDFRQSTDFQNGSAIYINTRYKDVRAGFLGNIFLQFDQAFQLNASIRRDGFNRYGNNRKWGWFPGLSASVDLSKYLKKNFLNEFRARVGYGITGQFTDLRITSIATYAQGGGFVYYNGNYIPVFILNSNPNPDLQWESRKEWNAGLDWTIFNRISGSIDWYSQLMDHLLLGVEAPSPPNYTHLSYLNIGKMKNRGIELTLGADILRTHGFSWRVGLMYSKNTNEVVDLGGVTIRTGSPGAPGNGSTAFAKIEEGEPFGRIVGMHFLNVDNTGRIVYQDINHDGYVDNFLDVIDLGNAFPRATYGIQNSFQYKKLDLSFFLRGVTGHSLINSYQLFYGTPYNLINYNVLASALEDDNIKIKENNQISDRVVEKASFLRLENLSIGYTMHMPGKHISRFRIYFCAQNMITITGYKGADPDVRLLNKLNDSVNNYNLENVQSPGIEGRNIYPSTKTWLLGVQLDIK